MHTLKSSTAVWRSLRTPHLQSQLCRLIRPPPPTLAIQTPFRTTASLSANFFPNFFTPLRLTLINFFQSHLSKMSSSATIDESLVTFLKTHAPNGASAETDPVRASQALFPSITYTDAEKTEISQWLITSSHLASNVRIADLSQCRNKLTRCDRQRTLLNPLCGCQHSIPTCRAGLHC